MALEDQLIENARETDSLFARAQNRDQLRMQRAITELENRIIEDVGSLQTRTGRLIGPKTNLKQAQKIHRKLTAMFDETYGAAARETVRGFEEASDQVLRNFRNLNVAATFTSIDKDMIKALQNQNLLEFTTLGAQAQERVSQALYNSVAAQLPMSELINTIRGALVGQVDARGTPLASYANLYARDAMMNFYNAVQIEKGDQAGLDHYLYFGNIMATSRDFCIARAGKVYSKEEIESWDFPWRGKRGPALTFRGGWNCRHHWHAVDPEWIPEGEIEVQNFFDENDALYIMQAPDEQLDARQLNIKKRLNQLRYNIRSGKVIKEEQQIVKDFYTLPVEERTKVITKWEADGIAVPDVLKQGLAPPPGPGPVPPGPGPGRSWKELSKYEKKRMGQLRFDLKSGKVHDPDAPIVQFWYDNFNEAERQMLIKRFEDADIEVPAYLRKGTGPKPKPPVVKPKPKPKKKTKPTPPDPGPLPDPVDPITGGRSWKELTPREKKRLGQLRYDIRSGKTLNENSNIMNFWYSLHPGERQMIIARWEKAGIEIPPMILKNLDDMPVVNPINKVKPAPAPLPDPGDLQGVQRTARKSFDDALQEFQDEYGRHYDYKTIANDITYFGPGKREAAQRVIDLADEELFARTRWVNSLNAADHENARQEVLKKLTGDGWSNNRFKLRTIEGTAHIPYQVLADLERAGFRIRWNDFAGRAYFNIHEGAVLFKNSFGSAVSHEVAHAIDSFMSTGGRGFRNEFGFWRSSAYATKKEGDNYRKWYRNQRTGGTGNYGNGDGSYYMGKWINDYEGRKYGNPATRLGEQFFSMGSERYADAFDAYKSTRFERALEKHLDQAERAASAAVAAKTRKDALFYIEEAKRNQRKLNELWPSGMPYEEAKWEWAAQATQWRKQRQFYPEYSRWMEEFYSRADARTKNRFAPLVNHKRQKAAEKARKAANKLSTSIQQASKKKNIKEVTGPVLSTEASVGKFADKLFSDLKWAKNSKWNTSKWGGDRWVYISDEINSAGLPTTIPGHDTATGMAIRITKDGKDLYFYEMTSNRSGGGRAMVESVLKNVPKGTRVHVHNDWSGGFWERMQSDYPQLIID